MRQATYNKDRSKRWPWTDIIFTAVIGGTLVAAIVFAPPGWWL